MTGLFGAFATILMLSTVIWLALGRPGRRADDRDARRRRGGRTARDRGFWGMPARDRAYAPGLLLLGITCVQLGEVVAAAGPGLDASALMLAAVVAIGFSIRPGIVGGGMGIIGVLSLLISRIGLDECGEIASKTENLQFLALALLFIVVLAVARIFNAPLRSGERIFRGRRPNFWFSTGRPRPPGLIGGIALVSAGVLDLLSVVLRPGAGATYGPVLTQHGWLWAAVIMAGATIGFGLALMPNFTLSCVGLLVGGLETFGLVAGAEYCRSVGLVFTVALVLIVINRVASVMLR